MREKNGKFIGYDRIICAKAGEFNPYSPIWSEENHIASSANTADSADSLTC
jgi:hypothetical protein